MIFWLNLTYILKSDIRFRLNANLNIYHWWKYYTETSFNMDFKKIYFFKKIQISTLQYCLKLQNIIYCIVNLKKHQ